MRMNKILTAYNYELNKFINDKLPNENIYKPISYIFNLGGKKIRPFFLLYSFKIFGGKGKKINQVALAIESLHNFSLIHDDVMDKAEKRRGKLTVQKKWNENSAILSGDALLIICFKILNSLVLDKKKELVNEFINSSLRICEGQQIDLEMENKLSISIDEYYNMIKLKTAALFEFCFKMGCYLAGGNLTNQNKMSKIGLKIGLLFQIQDDFLDFFGSRKVGKKIGQDVLENKKTYLFCEFITYAKPKEKKEFISKYNCKKMDSEKKIKYVANCFKSLDIKNKTLLKIEKIKNEIIGLISELDISEINKKKFTKYILELSKRIN